MSLLKRIAGMILACGCLVSLTSCQPPEEEKVAPVVEEPPAPPPVIEDVRIILKTDKGDISATLMATNAPMTCANFLNLAKRDYYDGVSFHRVVEDYVIQAGDPTGTGKGGPGYFIPNEIHPDLQHGEAGVLSMARKQPPDTAGSQFFITLGPAPHLDGLYSIFGKVTEGMETVMAIEPGDVIRDVEILDSTEGLFEAEKTHLAEWNGILDRPKEKPQP